VIALLVGAAFGLVVSILGTPIAIRVLRRRQIGQFIQEEIEGHQHKQGTPTMGGVVFVPAVVIAYVLAHVRLWTPASGLTFDMEPLGPGGLLAILALLGMASIGFLDDLIKYTRKRSLGLSKRAKFGGQLSIAALFAWGADAAGVSTELAFARPLGLDLGVFFVVLVLLMLTGAANGANLADGMDGLAAGSGALMFGAYTIISFWQWRNPEAYPASTDPRELAIIAAAMLGAILGFLWWNAPPARIFMGDVGSNAIGGLLAALALLTDTHLLLVLIAGLYVAETLSVILQVASFKATGRRIFRMAPFHFHFDLAGWPETTIVIRFWILAGIGVALGLGFFYADFIRVGGLLG
jgi:phospho-N-acetylmuramoyl-pentapeptide-transferase